MALRGLSRDQEHALREAGVVVEPAPAPSPAPAAGDEGSEEPETNPEAEDDFVNNNGDSMEGGLTTENYDDTGNFTGPGGEAAHEAAVSDMGTKHLKDLQPDYVYDDDFVNPGDSVYEE